MKAMQSQDRFVEDDLHALVDGVLEPTRWALVASAVRSNPCRAAQVTAYREQNAGLKALYDAVLDEAIPQSLRQVLDNARSHGGLVQAC